VPLAFHQILCFQAFANPSSLFPELVFPGTPWQTAATSVRPTTRPKGAVPALAGGGNYWLLHNSFFRSFFIPDDLLCIFRLIRWNSAPAPATTPAMASDSSGSSSCSHSSSSRYNDRDARRFKEERDATRHELEIFSEEAGIAELEWEHQRK
jgi:hypothetical protein